MKSAMAVSTLLAFLLSFSPSAAATPAGDMSPQLRAEVAAEFATLELRSSTDLQSFTGALAGIKASPITNSGDSQRPFEVAGNTFPDFASAGNRACSIQFNSCANAANAQKQITVGQCDTQQQQCNAAQSSATQQNFQTLTSQNADFDFFCDP